MALLILGYMVLGGYIAVAWNDVVRAVLMLLGLVALPVYGLVRVGGLAALGEVLAAVQPTALDPFRPDAGKAEPAAPDARKPGAGRSRPGLRGTDGSGS